MTVDIQGSERGRPGRLGAMRRALQALGVSLREVHRSLPTDLPREARSEELASALFRIAELTRKSQTLDEFYEAVHKIVGTLIDSPNFFIADYDVEKNVLHFPYFVDEFDAADDGADPGHGLTAWVLRTGKPLLATPEKFEELVAAGEVENVGVPSLDWLGVPLKSGDVTWGVLGTQSYHHSTRLTARVQEIFVFVAQHIASAIEQKRSETALRDSERRYRQMFENNRAVQLLIDPQSGTILDANVAACEFYGYPLEHLLNMRIWDINVLSAAAVHEEMTSAAAQKRSYFVFRHRIAGGEVRDVEVHSGPIDFGGKRVLYSIIHDITERRRAEQAVQASEEKYRNIFNYASVGIYQSTRDGRLLTANQALASMLGYESVDDLLPRNLATEVYVDPADREALIASFADTGYASERELRWRKRDGTVLWVQLSAHSIVTPDESILFEGFVFDITARKRAETVQRTQLAAMTASIDGIAILDESLRFTYVNDALAKLYGFSRRSELEQQPLSVLYDAPEIELFERSVLPAVRTEGRWRGETRGRRRDGAAFPQEISISAIEGGGFVCVVRDVTERTYAEDQIKHLAYHDALTNLPNRLLMKDRLSVAISHAQRDKTRLAVLFLDLDRFKVINDSLGHNIGDQLLQAVAARLSSCVRDSDTVSRLGGDEFTVILPDLGRSDDGAIVAEKILDAIRHPFSLDGREFFMTTSVGISLFPEDGGDAEALLKNADTAMYQAKEQGRDNYTLFNAHVNAKALQRIQLEHGLRRALANEDLQLHYQPIFDFRTGKVTGMEALLRWTHPELGPVPPAVFIPIAETTGMMIPMGAWVLRTACRQLREWHDVGYRNLTLAVNLSVTQLQQPDLVARIEETLRQCNVAPRFVEFEITETSAMNSPEASIKTLYDLKKIGVRISLDDFGTGHSSLSYLKRFPIDTLKIDQSFVRDITTDPDTAAIVNAIIAMAHSLRLKVVAEGVELTDQSIFLKKHGCDQMQGYLITPPVPASQFTDFLEAVTN
jgi:diguanylate cyclase (GGDEF)-like protein/PAS domain S-box-containing protein